MTGTPAQSNTEPRPTTNTRRPASRVIIGLLVYCAASTTMSLANPTHTGRHTYALTGEALRHGASALRLAPADEYFGPLKMSELGIRNEIHDLTVRYDPRADADHSLALRTIGMAQRTEASLADWEHKYPRDTQLARSIYLLQRLYAKIDGDDARANAARCTRWLTSRYSRTWYARNVGIAIAARPPAQNAPKISRAASITASPDGFAH
jgi:hypothetical protein